MNQTTKIKQFIATEILDSRGNPTIRVVCELLHGVVGEAMVPSGKSTGSHEALELRDLDMNRYNGLGVLKAVENINNEINRNLNDLEFDQFNLDDMLIKLDGTENKSRLGANAILGCSLSFAHAFALEQKIELYEYFGQITNNEIFKIPQPCLNIINGGRHSNSGLDLQEFMIVPVGFYSFSEKIDAAKMVVSVLENILKSKNLKTDIGDEGGFAPVLNTNEEALDLMVEAIGQAGYDTDKIKIAIDSAGSSFFENGKYILKVGGGRIEKTSIEMVDWYETLVNKYPIISIEDPLHEEDWEGFSMMNIRLGNKIKIIGDDLTVTNTHMIDKAIAEKAINSVLIKVNQIGTVSETIKAVNLTKIQGWSSMVSHRSGETMDTSISDLAVGFGCEFIKSGAPTRPERLCKYERLIAIEKSLV